MSRERYIMQNWVLYLAITMSTITLSFFCNNTAPGPGAWSLVSTTWTATVAGSRLSRSVVLSSIPSGMPTGCPQGGQILYFIIDQDIKIIMVTLPDWFSLLLFSFVGKFPEIISRWSQCLCRSVYLLERKCFLWHSVVLVVCQGLFQLVASMGLLCYTQLCICLSYI